MEGECSHLSSASAIATANVIFLESSVCTVGKKGLRWRVSEAVARCQGSMTFVLRMVLSPLEVGVYVREEWVCKEDNVSHDLDPQALDPKVAVCACLYFAE